MGRELQKKKNRSSLNKVKRKPKSKKRILSNSIIAANWDKTQTLTQNYRRLGLAAKLNKTTGGVEKTATSLQKEQDGTGGLANGQLHGLVIGGGSRRAAQTMEVKEVEVERDPKTGRILRVVGAESVKANPLGDPLNDLDSDEEDSEGDVYDQHGAALRPSAEARSEARTTVVRDLEREASRPEAKYRRHQSEGERAFVEELVEKYGDDYGKMARDMKINYMQRSEGDLKRRVKKWRESGGTVG
ncbi:ribosome biogenesis protein Nop16 [Neohortaea acidophila]|uniref:Nucleolar protein 16 n=1 Tax=Neohortaea acidophila TaxID=245834 RepID=A0A6A6PVM5_9PEZI|nr:ribosome biogenesis protein Nop16 [Neohortaea acidophila]KAF2484025.1 ribosome biogenesis protein Nop16 [Neohortaea acidophila]